MTDQRAILAQRAVGAYPLSIASSLTMESLAGVHPDLPPPPHPPIQDYQVVWVNLRTLFRNLYQSNEKGQQEFLTHHGLAEALFSEMEVLTEAIRDLQSTVKVYFYVNNYPDLVRRYPHALFRTDNTDLQKHYAAITVMTLESVMSQAKKVMKTPPFFFRGDMQAPQLLKSVIITNYAWDLTSVKQLGDTDLIESHTGRIKPPSQWYTKYYQGKEYPMIPFRRGLLPIFGDDTLFKPFPKSSRDAVMALAVKYDWSNVTSTDRLRFSLDQLEDKYLKSIIVSMLN
jgi:hypothetical protein